MQKNGGNPTQIHQNLYLHLEITRINYHSPKLYIQRNKPAAYQKIWTGNISLSNYKASAYFTMNDIYRNETKEKCMKMLRTLIHFSQYQRTRIYHNSQ